MSKFLHNDLYRIASEKGLYQSKNGTILNADVNGAVNILRKCKQNVDFDKLCKGLSASPVRISMS